MEHGTVWSGPVWRSGSGKIWLGVVSYGEAVEVCRGQVWSGGFRSGEAV